MGSEIILYDYWRSSASYRVRIALGLKGVAYEAAPVNLVVGDQRSQEHLARNPQGFVPVLDIDGVRLTQSLAILDYLEETRPAPPLLPSDPAERARVRAVAHAIAMEIHPVCNLSVATHAARLAVEGTEAQEAVKGAWMRHFIAKGLAAVEQLLPRRAGAGGFAFGPAPGLADLCIVPQIYNAERWGVSLAELPRLAATAAACGAHPAFVNAHPDCAKP